MGEEEGAAVAVRCGGLARPLEEASCRPVRRFGGELRRAPLPASRESRGRQRESGGGGDDGARDVGDVF